MMKPVFLAILVLFLNFGLAFAQGACESKVAASRRCQEKLHAEMREGSIAAMA